MEKIKAIVKRPDEMYGHQFFGTLIICGVDGDEFADIPMTFDEWKRFFFGGGLT